MRDVMKGGFVNNGHMTGVIVYGIAAKTASVISYKRRK